MRLSGGGYDKTLVIAGNFVANPAPDDTVDVRFDEVPITASYTVTYIGADGSQSVIVQGAPFHSLKDNLRPEELSGAPAPTGQP